MGQGVKRRESRLGFVLRRLRVSLVFVPFAFSVLVPISSGSANSTSQYSFDFNRGVSNTLMKTSNGTRVIPASTDFSVETWVYVDSDTGLWQTLLVQDQAETLMASGRFYLGFYSRLL